MRNVFFNAGIDGTGCNGTVSAARPPMFWDSRVTMLSLQQKKEVIIASEEAFTRSVATSLFQKPSVSFWMILIPFLLLYFIYRMKQYQNGRRKFEDEFMLTRRKVLDLAMEAETFDTPPQLEAWVQQAGLASELRGAYRNWISELSRYYQVLLGADGEDFAGLVRSGFGNPAACREAMQRLCDVEKAFHDALRPGMHATPGAGEIMTAIEERVCGLRRGLTETVFGKDAIDMT